MIKVHILDRCEFCNGEAYIFDYQDVDTQGETYDRYRPCEMCHGSGHQAKWIGHRELSNLRERAISMEPDYLELAREKPVSHFHDSCDAAGN
jgi:hypothetical protein